MRFFWLWFVFCAAASVATLGVGIWATVKVVNWVTAEAPAHMPLPGAR